jgi:predicted amidophosphoribosyltransferase
VRRVLLARKERGVTALTAPLSAALARSADTAAPAGPLALVPVPSSPAARRARGEHVVAVLARAAARRLRRAGRDVAVVPALAHARRVADSAELSAADRARNLAGALRARPHASAATAGRLVVVVDDLVTTGATLAECARALAAAGVATHAAAVVAATQRRG